MNDNSDGAYNALGAPGEPMARAAGAGAVDGNGNLWLYGGFKDYSKSLP